MKRFLFLIVISSALVLAPGGPVSGGGWICSGVPMIDQSGYQRLIKGSQGCMTVVSFWATWCAPCLREMPALTRLHQNYGARGVNVVLISANDSTDGAEVARVLQRNNVHTQAYIKKSGDDGAFIGQVDPRWSGALPATFIYNKSGALVQTLSGERTYEELERVVRPFLTKQ